MNRSRKLPVQTEEPEETSELPLLGEPNLSDSEDSTSEESSDEETSDAEPIVNTSHEFVVDLEDNSVMAPVYNIAHEDTRIMGIINSMPASLLLKLRYEDREAYNSLRYLIDNKMYNWLKYAGQLNQVDAERAIARVDDTDRSITIAASFPQIKTWYSSRHRVASSLNPLRLKFAEFDDLTTIDDVNVKFCPPFFPTLSNGDVKVLGTTRSLVLAAFVRSHVDLSKLMTKLIVDGSINNHKYSNLFFKSNDDLDEIFRDAETLINVDKPFEEQAMPDDIRGGLILQKFLSHSVNSARLEHIKNFYRSEMGYDEDDLELNPKEKTDPKESYSPEFFWVPEVEEICDTMHFYREYRKVMKVPDLCKDFYDGKHWYAKYTSVVRKFFEAIDGKSFSHGIAYGHVRYNAWTKLLKFYKITMTEDGFPKKVDWNKVPEAEKKGASGKVVMSDSWPASPAQKSDLVRRYLLVCQEMGEHYAAAVAEYEKVVPQVVEQEHEAEKEDCENQKEGDNQDLLEKDLRPQRKPPIPLTLIFKIPFESEDTVIISRTPARKPLSLRFLTHLCGAKVYVNHSFGKVHNGEIVFTATTLKNDDYAYAGDKSSFRKYEARVTRELCRRVHWGNVFRTQCLLFGIVDLGLEHYNFDQYSEHIQLCVRQDEVAEEDELIVGDDLDISEIKKQVKLVTNNKEMNLLEVHGRQRGIVSQPVLKIQDESMKGPGGNGKYARNVLKPSESVKRKPKVPAAPQIPKSRPQKLKEDKESKVLPLEKEKKKNLRAQVPSSTITTTPTKLVSVPKNSATKPKKEEKKYVAKSKERLIQDLGK